MPTSVQIAAPAKINLSLEITGKRPDGYHEVVSLMRTVSLDDTLTLEPAEHVSVTVLGAELPEDNLVRRAAQLLRQQCKVETGCAITLEKCIPVAAGLGGGSSDGASTLLGLCRLWDLALDHAALLDLAAKLGSDVPFFLNGGTALIEGRGEVVTELPAPQSPWYLLVNPGFAVSTAAVYAALRRDEWTGGDMTRKLAAGLQPGSPAPLGINTLQAALFRVSPEARECFQAAAEVSAGRAMVSGSGPTIFAPFEDGGEASTACSTLRDRGYWAEVTRAIAPREEAIACV